MNKRIKKKLAKRYGMFHYNYVRLCGKKHLYSVDTSRTEGYAYRIYFIDGEWKHEKAN